MNMEMTPGMIAANIDRMNYALDRLAFAKEDVVRAENHIENLNVFFTLHGIEFVPTVNPLHKVFEHAQERMKGN